MSKKYVIEIKPEYEDSFKGVMLLGAKDSDLYVDTLAVENLEQYIPVDVEKIYDKAFSDGYKRGLEDAWEAARKLFSSMADSDIEKAFPTEWNNGGFKALMNLQPQEAIAKLKAYEEHKDDSIKVGDEVERYVDGRYDGRAMFLAADGDRWTCLFWTGCGYTTLSYPKSQFRRTGRHFDIEEILEAMRT